MNHITACDTPSAAGVADVNSDCAINGGSYICQEQYTGMLCDQCHNGFYNNSNNCTGKF